MLGLKTSLIGKKVVYFQEISSTNDVAKSEKFEEGTVIVADVQISGHGRLNRKWESPRGGLWLSVILQPNVSMEDLPKITFLGAVAVVRTLEEFSVPARIKWPNDVLVDFKKIAGILVEKKGKRVILGIGLNVNNDAPENGTSMKLYLGSELALTNVFKSLIENLDELYKVFMESPRTILELARELMILGVPVKVVGDGEVVGVAEDVDDYGRLIVRLEDGSKKAVIYGDVSLRFL
ncbi:biotin--[acetyl-CoA-carboxylase] ligase [Pyrococcus sp. ST04]|uniref:biotin--[acetyl-CoA-carboxylase] ligase n=1 Tax=Pyrococcus sp. ST04 TaxID=1183377 RepID=UPI0002605954|nr:biotin--[acetyl-CoA-carboxylase] ligase [Pyrococcus sp. ST04]AFK21765.1 putative Biotin protein ligase [Pyrococcus sp. ST04]